MKEELIEMARVGAIQEAMCGFLLDEVINPKGEFHGDRQRRSDDEEADTLL